MQLSQIFLVPAVIVAFGTAHAAKPSPSVHKVKKGETASKIARLHQMSLSQLAALNPKVNLAKLSLGMALKLTGSPRHTVEAVPEASEASAEEVKPTSLEARKENLAPVEALPIIPSSAPSTLIHLERVLPSHLQKSISTTVPETGAAALAAASPTATFSRFTPVILPSTGMEYESQIAANLGFEPADPAHLDLLWPVETRSVSSAWGPRIRTRTVRVVKSSLKKRIRVRYRGSHKGVDLTAPIGTDVYAAMDGRVVITGKHRQYGNYVVIDHGNGIQTLYAHHRINYASAGDIVRRGQKIAEVGRTGNATGPHLHFELRMQGQPQNPIPYLDDVEEIPAELVAFNNASAPPAHKR